MVKTYFNRISKIIFSLLGVLLTALLLALAVRDNTIVENKRYDEVYTTARVTGNQIADEDSLTGVVMEYSYPLDMEIKHDEELMFLIAHHYIDVWIGGEHVYSLRPSGELSFIKTLGNKWVCIPLYAEDEGKTVRIKLTPVYDDYEKEEIELMVGSSLAIYRSQFKELLPAILLSAANIFAGIILLAGAIYYSIKEKKGSELLSISMLGITVGIWQLADNDVSPFIMEGKAIFLYYLAVIMVLVCMIPLVRAVGVNIFGEEKKALQYYSVGVGTMGVVQLMLQIMGIIDLREMFMFTHGSIAVGALLLIIVVIIGKIKGYVIAERKSIAWILAVGILGDLLLYYLNGTASGLIVLLSSVLIFMVIEGFRFLSGYFEQGRLLEEKETQLVNSRVMTLMSQIRSHFVFNILNAISGMCKYDPEKADETIVRFSRYLRNNIDIMQDDALITFDMELQRLEDYILLEQVRFGNRIEFVTDLEVTDFMIPPLVLQPVVENSIKHGLTKKKDGGTILLSTWEEDGDIMISIDDDGIGFNMNELEKEKSVGLKNIRFRLHHLLNGNLIIKSEIDKGTKAIISFPRREA